MISSHCATRIHFFFDNVPSILKNRQKLKSFIGHLFKKEGKRLSGLNYIFCTDQTLLKVNRQYLHHDFYTDVISFNLSDSPNEIIAEVYISVDRIRANAEKFKISMREELHRAIFHGALHLCGYTDKRSSDKEQMSQKEDSYLNDYFKCFT
jgi:probable rRNA maturation factor